jgi:predicted CXXCH cytochrome family protein
MSSYLETGHKNILRKVKAGQVWAGADGRLLSGYFVTDAPPTAGNSLYDSGSTFDWLAGTITVGDGPPTVPYTFGGNPNPLAGTTQDLFYAFGGWSDPTALDTIFRGGFTGEQFPAGNYDCARCHTTGYRFDDNGVEPSWNGAKIAAADFSRIPTDFTCSDGVSSDYRACVANGGTVVSASWMLDGVQCERCHTAQAGHVASGDPALVTKPTAESATALCLQCHREENVDTVANQFTFGSCSDAVSADYATCIAIAGNTWVTDLVVYDGGSCSDGVSADYATCVGITGNTWSYAPFFDHESGPTFLNGPHARFSGQLSLASQNTTDMTLVLTGAYDSAFTDGTGANAGCTGCHDPHQSIVPVVGAQPFVKGCTDCHPQYANAASKMSHPVGPGTPFDTGGDLNAACAVCHMSQSYHLFRISTDAGYSTFPTAAQIAAGGGQGIPNTASDGRLVNAVWADVDLACGQCHVGSGLLPGQPPAAAYSKAYLAGSARCIHNAPVVHASAGANGSISPVGTSFLQSGASQSFTFRPDPGYEVKSITVDAMFTPGPATSYAFSNVTGCHTVSVQFAPVPTLTATAGAGGTISPAGVTQVPTGGTQTFTIAANPGYQIQTVLLDGGTSLGAVGSYTFANNVGSHTIAAYFVPTKFTITGSAGANGTIFPPTASVLQGSSQTFRFTPSAGYHAETIAIDGGAPVPASSSYTFANVQANHAIAVSFAANPAATIVSSVDPANASGTMTPAPTTLNLLAGQSQSFSFTPNTNYRVGNVVVDGVSKGRIGSYTFYDIAPGSHSISVSFVPDTFTITANAYGQGGGAITETADSNVIVSAGSGTTTIPDGGKVTYTFTPATGFTILNVNVDSVSQGAIGSYAFSNVTLNHAISVTFAPKP